MGCSKIVAWLIFLPFLALGVTTSISTANLTGLIFCAGLGGGIALVILATEGLGGSYDKHNTYRTHSQIQQLPPEAAPYDHDIEAALVGLGYSKAQARTALLSNPPDPSLPVEERITRALYHLAPPLE